MIWKIPRMWEGGECWIIGGGPSLSEQFEIPQDVIDKVISGEETIATYSPFLSSIHDKHIIGVNAAFLLGNWIDITFFGDGGFYRDNARELNKVDKMKITCNINAKKMARMKGVKFIHRDRNHSVGISKKKGFVSWNGNSGAAAINLAVHLGAKRIYLLGFDMKVGVNKRQHWHSHYNSGKKGPRDPRKLPFHRHLKGFPMIAKEAKKQGIEIINVSPNSAIKSFKRVSLNEVI